MHVVNYNDIESVKYVLKRYPVACVIMEPILQNVGILKPQEGYLQEMRRLADQEGFLLIFDEVKTGFRHALGGYQSICGVTPDLSSFGKAVANGYPMGVIAGKKEYMDYFIHPEKKKRVLIAGTYNAHPLTTAAAIATVEKLADPEADVYGHVERLGATLEKGLNDIFAKKGRPFYVARQDRLTAYILWTTFPWIFMILPPTTISHSIKYTVSALSAKGSSTSPRPSNKAAFLTRTPKRTLRKHWTKLKKSLRLYEDNGN